MKIVSFFLFFLFSCVYFVIILVYWDIGARGTTDEEDNVDYVCNCSEPYSYVVLSFRGHQEAGKTNISSSGCILAVKDMTGEDIEYANVSG